MSHLAQGGLNACSASTRITIMMVRSIWKVQTRHQCLAMGAVPLTPPERIGDPAGSTATTWTDGFAWLKHLPTLPVMVPPVPTPATQISSVASVSPGFLASSYGGFRDWRDCQIARQSGISDHWLPFPGRGGWLPPCLPSQASG